MARNFSGFFFPTSRVLCLGAHTHTITTRVPVHVYIYLQNTQTYSQHAHARTFLLSLSNICICIRTRTHTQTYSQRTRACARSPLPPSLSTHRYTWVVHFFCFLTSSVFAVCCSVLQCVAACCGVLRSVVWIHVGCPFLLLSHKFCVSNRLQCVAVCCSMLQRVAVCCGVLRGYMRVVHFLCFLTRSVFKCAQRCTCARL